jgi:hypothetical protein
MIGSSMRANDAIVDYGAGNLNSVKKAFDYLGANVVLTTQPETVAAAEKIVLPGVGHFSALGALDNTGLRDAVLQGASAGKPFLGICLGMQWLFEGSDEAPEFAGAGIFAGRCRPFPASVKSPHVGWNSLRCGKVRACCATSRLNPLSTSPILFKRRWLPHHGGDRIRNAVFRRGRTGEYFRSAVSSGKIVDRGVAHAEDFSVRSISADQTHHRLSRYG